MSDEATDALVSIIPPLLTALDTLGLAARHLDPSRLDVLLDAVGNGDTALLAVEPTWPEDFAPLGAKIDAARRAVLSAFEELRAACEAGDIALTYRAMRYIRRAEEALFPLAAGLSPVSRYFLPAPLRGDPEVAARLANAPPRDDTGIAHVENETAMRGGFSLFVPEDYTPETPLPLIVALHGGSGHGREFLWSWIREARGYGAILVAPTSVGRTWALNDADADTPNLLRMIEGVRRNWSVDPARMLMTGMSDGGTFCYVSGLDAASPFTHLAPIAASFHPMLAAAADPARLQGLPIFLTHGARDWMFPIDIAREAMVSLSAAGASVTYREIEDLSHTYPREINAEIMAWLKGD